MGAFGHRDRLPLVAALPAAGATRRTQMVALAVLILILFPVISVTDDLQAIQNPAEVDSCLRRERSKPLPGTR
jgi:hypothetical protein